MNCYLTGFGDPICCVAYLPAQESLVAADNRHLFFWQIGHPEPTTSAELSHRGLINLVPIDHGQQLITWEDVHGTLWGRTTQGWQAISRFSFLDTPRGLWYFDQTRELHSFHFDRERAGAYLRKYHIEHGRLEESEEIRLPIPTFVQDPFLIHPSMDRNKALDLSQDGLRFATADTSKRIHVWEGGPLEYRRTLKTRGFAMGVSWSPDGQWLAIDAGTSVHLYSTPDLTLARSVKTKYTYGPSLAWSPDSRLFARTDTSTTVRAYDPYTGQEMFALTNKRGVQWCLTFSPDGLTLAVGTYTGAVYLWDVG
jgi:WD40 repeat protein